MGSVVIAGSLDGLMVIAQNARAMGSILALGTIFPIFITLTTIGRNSVAEVGLTEFANKRREALVQDCALWCITQKKSYHDLITR